MLAFTEVDNNNKHGYTSTAVKLVCCLELASNL